MEEIIRYLILGSLAAIVWRDAGKSQDKTRGINHVAAQISTGYLPNKSAWHYSQCHIASFDHNPTEFNQPSKTYIYFSSGL